MLANVVEVKVELTCSIFLHACGYTDTARLSQALKSGCDVDGVAEDIAVLDNDVAGIDADAELNAIFQWYSRVSLDDCGLDLGCTPQCVHDTAELGEEAITRRFEEPAVMRGDLRIEQLVADRFDRLESAVLVCPDQPRISRHIGGKDCRKPAR